ncbi:MAG: SigB/SigF/SigG family RNA polymerase sigma factor [Actinomycetota bacterium]
MNQPRGANKDRTKQLFAQLKDDPSTTSTRDELVTLHMPLVEYLARKFRGRGEPLDDLIQVGSIGLLKAIAGFDPDRGLEFSTYATPTVLGEIKRYFRDHSWAIKVPRRLQEVGLMISNTVPLMSQELGRGPTIPEIANRIKTSDEEVLEAMEASRSYSLASLDAPAGDDGAVDRASTLGAEDESIQLFEAWSSVRGVLERLPQRERQVLYMRFVSGKTQTQIALALHISQMHVSRLLSKALAQVRQDRADLDQDV